MTMKASSSSPVALIGDLVGSRLQADRAATQRRLVRALDAANELTAPAQRLRPTIGDEFQGVFDDVGAALTAGLVVRLALAGGGDARCGVGVGALEIVGSSDYGLTQDGPAWWAARDAIVEAKRREGGQAARLRTWLVVHHEEDADGTTLEPDLVNAYLLCRDDVVSRLDARQRRLVLGLMRGATQKQLAADEGISASAVSQSLRRSGAYALLGATELVGGSRR